VIETPASDLEAYARYAATKFTFDDEFDHIDDRAEWMMAVCKKQRKQ
jgi:hypothetical protein